MNNIVPIVFCADAKYGAYLYAVLQSIIDSANAADTYRIIVLDCGIEAESLRRAEQIIKCKGNFSLHIENIEPWLKKHEDSFKETGYLSKAMYGRLLIPEICAEYEKAIYAEIDCVFNRDIAELFSLDLGQNYIGAVIDPLTEADRLIAPETAEHIKNSLKLTDADSYVFSGFLVFNILAWRRNRLAGKCIDFLRSNKTVFPDQDAINAVCRGKIIYLPQLWCVTILADLTEERFKRISPDEYPRQYALLEEWRLAYKYASESAIHYNGPLKPWMNGAERTLPLAGYWRFAASKFCSVKLPDHAAAPLVSIIVPFFNVEKELPRCLASLTAQTYRNIEILLIDDVSADGSLKIAKDFAGKDSRIRILNLEFTPPVVRKMKEAGARNLGLDCARGKYIMFCDSDDYYEPNMAELMAGAMEKNPEADLASCSVKVHQIDWEDDSLEANMTFAKTELLDFTQHRKSAEAVPLWNKIFRREIFEKYKIRAYTYPERSPDQNIASKYFAVSRKIYHLSDRLYNYVLRADSIMGQSGSDRSKSFLCFLEHLGDAASFCARNNVWDKNVKYFERIVTHLLPPASSACAAAAPDNNAVSNIGGNAAYKQQIKDYCFFGISFLKAKKRWGKRLYYLFGFRLLKVSETAKNKKYYILGVKLFNVKTRNRFKKRAAKSETSE